LKRAGQRSMLQVKGRFLECQAGRNTCVTADLPGGARTGGRSSPGIGSAAALAAAAAPLWLVAAVVSVLRRWEGEARVEPPCDAPSSRRSRDLLAGVRGADNLRTRRNDIVKPVLFALFSFFLLRLNQTAGPCNALSVRHLSRTKQQGRLHKEHSL